MYTISPQRIEISKVSIKGVETTVVSVVVGKSRNIEFVSKTSNEIRE